MSKVTSKLQLTVPKVIAEQFRIRPGDDLQWLPAGDAIRIVPSRTAAPSPSSLKQRLELFDDATQRQRKRERGLRNDSGVSFRRRARGWKREDLYHRGSPR